MRWKQQEPESGILKKLEMNYFRAIFSGFLVWLCVGISFYILDLIPFLHDYFNIQAIIMMIAIVFFAIVSAEFYYKNGTKTNGYKLGFIMSGTALLLDVFITVPFVEIPNGRSYESFFSSPVLWLLAIINALSVSFYWRKKIKS